ncbi:putative quinol monooxygenase [Algibacillus agarilyticus]|uniref:putative quinol monooxygenase n=1 Tax=Algibacillus agarilyticus TaxID=2234133 RepID=UPI001E365A00|nr:antibiotic biosynthesis monooxygenase [Algibacillus agarilyticus]
MTIQGYILIPSLALASIKHELILHTKLTKQEPGCLKFEVTPDKTQPNKLNVYEEFIDQCAFDQHQARVKTSQWGKMTTQVERHYQITYID